MKLSNVTKIDYNIKEDLQQFNVDRLIREIGEDVAPTVASWYVLNESTNQYEINPLLVNEGIKDLLKKGMGKVNDAITKGYSDLDAIKTKVVSGLKGKGDPGILTKLGEIAKKNAKYIKPAMMVAVVGASLLGMDSASASEALNAFDQMGGQEFQQYAQDMQSQFQDFDNGGSTGGQVPQEDQAVQYQGGAGSAEPGQKTIMNVLKYAQGKGADTGEISKALNSMKIDGLSVQDFAAKAEQSGNGKGAMQKIINSLMDTQGNGGSSGGQETTTVTNTTGQGNAANYDAATGKWK